MEDTESSAADERDQEARQSAQPDAEAEAERPSCGVQQKLLRLPLSRIKGLIKADPEVTLASQEAVFAIGKATELFVEVIAKDAYTYALQAKRKTIQRKDLGTLE
ncbi:DNA polymerase epsilon subunit 4 isoform X2 [Narcine bancroftii]|uniref:DNA polymerase epsilon subunit 4 isoform X2 n=1 Tax=Narcine bancroftii TaxID=1343680 RepID=UPI00383127C2